MLRIATRCQRASRASLHQRPATSLANRFVRLEDSRIEPLAAKDGSLIYPTPGHGHNFHMNIFGLIFGTDHINVLQDAVWNDESFLPTRPAGPLPADSPLADLSTIGGKMALVLEDGSTRGLLAENKLRTSVAQLGDAHFQATMELLKAFKWEPDPVRKAELGQTISDVAFWAQWLIRGVLFEGKLHWERFCEPVVRAPLSKIAFAANAALGRHQVEFVYDDYTLKAADFDPSVDLEAVDYDDSRAILDAIASIRTPVGFNSMAGHTSEHNFRHNHSVMEFQMRRAFKGTERVLGGDSGGWEDLIEAARRANRVFHTMLSTTTPASYPAVRLPIKGVRGACGSVYHPHGVLYEGVGSDEFDLPGVAGTLRGCLIDDEWGQTGANSSMYKYFDIMCGVTQARRAYQADPMMMSKMAAVFDRRLDSGELGRNPIDSMQRAFDLFTRPPRHMRMLVSTERALLDSGVLEDNDPAVLLQRLRLAYWVADHRVTHGKYVHKAIYKTEPEGGQSRAQGTGGSTPPFLKLFLDQTLAPARDMVIKLLLQRDCLSAEQAQEVQGLVAKFAEFDNIMERVREKGLQLEFEELGGRY